MCASFLAKMHNINATKIIITLSINDYMIKHLMGIRTADIPRINKMLKILEPTAFPNANPLSPFLVATIEVVDFW